MKEKGYSDPKPDELHPGQGSSPSVLREYEDRLFEDYLRFARAAGATEEEIAAMRSKRSSDQRWSVASEWGSAFQGVIFAFAGVRGARDANRDTMKTIGLRASLPGQVVVRSTAVIGRMNSLKDPLTLRPSEYTLRFKAGATRRETWATNYGELRKAMREGLPIRDASPTDDNEGFFLNLERFTLKARGWKQKTINGDNFWVPPGYRAPRF